MRNLRYLWVVVVLFLFGQAVSFAANDGSLSSLVNSKRPIKVFLKDFVNESGQNQIKPEDFKAAVEKSMLNRKSVKFEIVKDPAASDVQVSAVIKKYEYLVRGPLRLTPSTGTAVLDMAATATQNFVEMYAQFIVTDTKTNNILWNDKISEYKKKIMTPGESIPIIYDKVARTFLWKSFGKPTN